jgi:MerR family transcriptional regulator, heat shock protein HspR
VYIISVAAELAGVHPQTLRIYERKGLLQPARTPGNTRRYSERDIARLRTIQRLTQEHGLNLAGVKMIVEMEDQLERMRQRVVRMDRELERARERMRREMERMRRQTARAEIVPLSAVRSMLGQSSPSKEEGAQRRRRRSVPIRERERRSGPIPVGPGRDEAASSSSPG